eukprot:7970483-Pyramimonas_sp.AAC.1
MLDPAQAALMIQRLIVVALLTRELYIQLAPLPLDPQAFALVVQVVPGADLKTSQNWRTCSTIRRLT